MYTRDNNLLLTVTNQWHCKKSIGKRRRRKKNRTFFKRKKGKKFCIEGKIFHLKNYGMFNVQMFFIFLKILSFI